MSQTTMIAMLEEAEDVLRRAGCDVTADKVRGVLQAQQAEPRCACGDSFTSDAVCANCLAAQQQAEPEQQEFTVASPDVIKFLRALQVRHHDPRREDDSALGRIGLKASCLLANMSSQPAVAQQQAEPVAWVMFDRHGVRTGWTSEKEYTRNAYRSEPLYAQPPTQPVARDVLMALARDVERELISGGYVAFSEQEMAGIVDRYAAHPLAQQQAEPVAYGKTPGCKQCDEAEACGLTFCPECDAQFCAGHAGAEEIAAQQPAVAVPDEREAFEAWLQESIDDTDTVRPSKEKVDAYFAVWLARAMLAAAPQGAAPAQAAAMSDELTCEDIERLCLALSWEGYSTPESLEACAARWPSLVRDLIAGVLDRKKRTQDAAQKGGEA